jgi:hypothetical protein
MYYIPFTLFLTFPAHDEYFEFFLDVFDKKTMGVTIFEIGSRNRQALLLLCS